MRYKLGIFVIASSLLSGCTTMMWAEGRTNNSVRQVKQQDSIVAFGRTKADSQTMPANQLLMLGQKHVYLITNSRYSIMGKQSASNEKLTNILNVDLSRSFEVSTSIQGNDKGYFPVKLNKDTQSFSSYFCLHYAPNTALSKKEQALEQQKLDDLQFETRGDGQRYLCMTIDGKVYDKPNDMAYQHHFKNPVPVQLTVEYKGINTMPVLRALTLPFAIATDIVTLPVQAVFYAALANASW